MVANDFDELLERFGNHHTYQKWILAIALCPISMLIAFTINLAIFQMAVPEHWCHVPGKEKTKFSDIQWKILTIPNVTGEYSSCLQYKVEWPINEGELEMPVIFNETQACQNGWEYNRVEFTSTWATEFGWFCEQKDNSKNIFSTFYVGGMIGSLLLAAIADKYTGRRLMFYTAMAIYFVFSLPLIWISDYTAHVFLRFLSGISYQANFYMPYLTILEVVSPEMRAMASLLAFVFWTLGMCFSSLVAWLIPRWDYLNFFACLPSLVCFLYWRYLPESPRWLLAKGRVPECADIIIKIAKVNKKPLPRRSDLELELEVLKNQGNESLSITRVFRYPNLRRNTILFFIHFFNSFLAYLMMLLSMNILSSNFFLSHFVLSTFQLPSNFLGWVMTHYLGRRLTLFSTVFLTGAFSVAACFCLQDKWILLVIIGFMQLFSTMYIYIIFVMWAEILPTPVRSSGFSWVYVSAILAMIVSPHAVTDEYGKYFPYLLIVAAMVVSLMASWPLPETIGLPLPQSFHDSETLGEGRPLTTWIHHWNVSRYLKKSRKDVNNEELTAMMENVM